MSFIQLVLGKNSISIVWKAYCEGVFWRSCKVGRYKVILLNCVLDTNVGRSFSKYRWEPWKRFITKVILIALLSSTSNSHTGAQYSAAELTEYNSSLNKRQLKIVYQSIHVMIMYHVQTACCYLVDDCAGFSSAGCTAIRLASPPHVAGERTRGSCWPQPWYQWAPRQWRGRKWPHLPLTLFQWRQTLHAAGRSQAQALWCFLCIYMNRYDYRVTFIILITTPDTKIKVLSIALGYRDF